MPERGAEGGRPLLFLLCRLGEEIFAIEAAQVGEVLPMVQVTPLARAPRGVAGLINHRGTPVPVVDLGLLALGRPAPRKLSTRIVLVRASEPEERPRWLGLILEHATETLRREPEAFLSPGVAAGVSASLGPVLTDERGLIQWIDLRRILPAEVRQALLRQPSELT
ncbi:chemotaxis protein CheW [Pararoseomonas indoligenes]|uniref:Purine-binding chemotaxis protein CheW n=1 Tax=Roseomonas indoligenes TaxID=2820811 RepID=A0A940S991_9PROT|nr:chemotaxis protein CheW [Pararoseomonas indoligenes]MBP0495013.1 purine-binding chemotaxis protein CheW [Pararoseomonas indoligenes]